MKKGGGTNKKDSQNNYKEHLLQIVYRDKKNGWNQSTVSTEKRLVSLHRYLIASEIDTIHDTNNGYEITCLWKAKYNIRVYMIQTNADFIFQKLVLALKSLFLLLLDFIAKI